MIDSSAQLVGGQALIPGHLAANDVENEKQTKKALKLSIRIFRSHCLVSPFVLVWF